MKERIPASKRKKRRRATPKQTEIDVLVRSRRRCCLCAFLENDFSVKAVQIAHIDQNPSNNDPNNLIPLCAPHHDDYDSTRSQTKGITAGEIKHYQSELVKVLQQTDEQIQINIVGIRRNEDSSDRLSGRPSARLLGEVLQAFDEEILRVRLGESFTGRATGIKLARLGQRAIIEEGDLDVALEAFMSLLRLSHTTPRIFSGGIRHHPSSPRLTPHLSTIELLSTMQKDWMLISEAVSRAMIYALIGDKQLAALSNYKELPSSSWKTVVDIFYHNTKFVEHPSESGECGGSIMMSLTDLLVGLGIVYTSRGLKLPDPPREIRITMSNERGVEPGEPAEIFPYVYLANKIAMLSKDDFAFALGQLEHYRYPVSQVIVDPENYMLLTLDEAKEKILSCAVCPGSDGTFVAVSDQESQDVCLKLRQELQETGQKVSDNAKAFLINERNCATNQNYYREGTNAPYSCFVNMETDDVGIRP